MRNLGDMICCSIQNKGYRQILDILKSVEMAEIRLDLCDLTEEQIEKIFSQDVPLIATCRAPQGASYGEFARTERLLTLAIRSGAHYADLEIEAPKPVSKRIAQACAEWGSVMIRSYHDFSGTPDLEQLRELVDKCRHHDGEIVKIVTTANSPEDAALVNSLYKSYTPASLVAFAMGEYGRQSRLECLRCGAPFTYAALSAEEATAPGQWVYDDMFREVYGGRPMLDAGVVRMPASKSYAQRAVVAAALAEGKSVLKGYTPCADSEAAVNIAGALGANVIRKRGAAGTTTLEIDGIAAAPSCMQDLRIDVGESGLLTRLMTPIAAQLCTGEALIEGHGTLLRRPLQDAARTMAALGAQISSEGGSDIFVPLKVSGPLGAGRITVDGSKSSQLVSGALMALPLGDRNSSLSVQNPTSIPYLYMTLDIMRHFGVKARSEMYGGRKLLDNDWSKCTEILLKLKENQRYKAAELDIEGDWSAATVFLAAAAIFGKATISGLDTSSLQADLGMIDLLIDAGASVSQMDEPKGPISVQKAPLRALKADLSNSPDLFPVVAVFCAFCQGRSSLRGVHRLLHKESNRADNIVNMLVQMGVKARIKDDDLIIDGESLDSRILSGRLLKGGAYTSSADHRMVMALRLAELGADSPVEIDDTACVAKSYPEFNKVWNEYIWKKL